MSEKKNSGIPPKNLDLKKVLMVAYYFPPDLTSATFRAVKFIKYLPLFGWKSIVVTRKILTPNVVDPSLKKDIPNIAEVHRVFSLDRYLANVLRMVKINPEKLLFPDEHVFWIPSAIASSMRIINKEDVDVIFTTGPPWSNYLVGLVLKRITKKPWIAEFRDPWSWLPEKRFPMQFYEKLAERIEHIIGTNADKLVMATEEMKVAFFEKYKDLSLEKCVVIPNGYDLDDFRSIVGHKTKEFTITFTGSLYKGFSKVMIDFLYAVNRLTLNNYIPRGDVKIVIAGSGLEDISLAVGKLRMNDIVDIKGLVPFKESLRLIMSSDVLLLILPSYGKKRNPALTWKLFNYLAAGKTILGIVPESPAKDLIIEANAGVVVHPSDKEGIGNIVRELYKSSKNRAIGIKPDWNTIKKYDRKVLTKKLAEVFDDLV